MAVILENYSVRMATRTSIVLVLMSVLPAPSAFAQAPPTHLQTRWAKNVTADRVLPEYPRPQLVRAEWQNLNGSWEYAITSKDAARPDTFTGRILVPFPVQSQLSGVALPVTDAQRLWYRRTFPAPRLTRGEHVLLHFGAVDWEAGVFVNGTEVGRHAGGYDPFTIDITAALSSSPNQELVVSVWDPTDRGPQPRGKQVLEPKSIWYTAVTGIWQTVWLETVPAAYVADLEIVPDVDAGRVAVRIIAPTAPAGTSAQVSALDGSRTVADVRGNAGSPLTLPIPNARLWSPSDPFLYRLRVRLDGGDDVESYFGLRKIAVQQDPAGVNRLFLNNKPLFQYGLLDQGWWPDGLYTAPTDEALRSDIETSKRLGFNLIRKHVKVEPARWYYHCDRLGMLVWQDMPSGDRKTPDAKDVFARELEHVVDSLRNHPSIVMWVPFNEGWGQHDTERYVAWLKQHDPTRPVNNASGWNDTLAGDVSDLHVYPGPGMPALEEKRTAVLGEFGGLGLPIEGHTWIDKGNWGYRSFTTAEELGRAYRELLRQLRIMAGEGLAAAIYTQTTDVEIEVNGMLTYDREVVKLPPDAPDIHARLFAPPAVKTLLPSSDRTPQQWRYTVTAPEGEWFRNDYDDRGWQQGTGGFGKSDTQHVRVRTTWETPDIWIRRTFNVAAPAVDPHLRIYHDEDATVYLNGQQVATLAGSNGGYTYVPFDAKAAGALRVGSNTIAVHVKQTKGGQFIDAGIIDVIERK
jgi:hypothetical protein